MLIIPAIDLMSRRVVRLFQGDFSKQTFYSDDPAEVAKKWEDKGAKLLHVVDLDGAIAGEPKNLDIIEKIKDTVKVAIEVGGGLRKEETIEAVLSKGISRAVIGTRAYNDEEFIRRLIAKFKDRIAVSIDASGKSVVAEGWRYATALDAVDLAETMESLGVQTIIYTNVLRDGTLEKPQLEPIKEIADSVKINLIVSGGISSIQDIIDIKNLGRKNIVGVIVGKALYEGRLELKEAIKIAEESNI